MKRKRFLDDIRLAACSWFGKKIVVFGDSILDEFICGRTDRVSREAPVVIVRYEESNWACGGAANAARNIISLGGSCSLVSLTGKDEHGRILVKLLRKEGLRVAGVVRSSDVSTTVKTRVMAGDYHAQLQQVLRIDRETRSKLSEKLENSLLRALELELVDADAVLMSDYDQGIFSDRVIEASLRLCRIRGKPVIVDSRSVKGG